jgi:hypothetical protein
MWYYFLQADLRPAPKSAIVLNAIHIRRFFMNKNFLDEILDKIIFVLIPTAVFIVGPPLLKSSVPNELLLNLALRCRMDYISLLISVIFLKGSGTITH